jgi:phosphoribosyl-ATP pyrophosphohydrolase
LIVGANLVFALVSPDRGNAPLAAPHLTTTRSNNMEQPKDDIISAVYRVIQERKANPSDSSYTASLMNKGIDKILKKLGEEATEVVIAGKGGKREEIVYETADLIFHNLVLLGFYDIDVEEVYAELRRRFGTSGITEKESRVS